MNKIVLLRALLLILLTFTAKMGINAEEKFNKPIVEAWHEIIGDTKLHYAGVDEDGDGFSDFFITVPYTDDSPVLRRIANLLREGATVSYEDQEKRLSSSLGSYTLQYKNLLEINGRSMLQYFPDRLESFSFEAARQERLQRERGE